MRKLRSRLTYANVMSTLAVGLVVAGGTAYAANTIGSSDIIDESIQSQDVKNGEVKSTDVGNNQVQSADIKNGSLNDEDIAQETFVNFNGNIGTVPAQACVERVVTGVNAQGDHLILTPNFDSQASQLVYSAESRGTSESMVIQACNPTTNAIDDVATDFNLLVIDAQ